MYSFALLKPVFPIANDIIAHTFYKMQHMTTVHYENGAYHLHAELIDESNRQQNKSKETTPSFMFETLANHLYNKVFEFEIYQTTSSIKFSHDTKPLQDAFIQITTPPPRA